MGTLAIVVAAQALLALVSALWISSVDERSERAGKQLWALWWFIGFGLSPFWAMLIWFVVLIMSDYIPSGGEGFVPFFAAAACLVTVPVAAIGFFAFGRRGSSGQKLRSSLGGALLLSLGLAAVYAILVLKAS